jgi:hypothetical protein
MNVKLQMLSILRNRSHGIKSVNHWLSSEDWSVANISDFLSESVTSFKIESEVRFHDILFRTLKSHWFLSWNDSDQRPPWAVFFRCSQRAATSVAFDTVSIMGQEIAKLQHQWYFSPNRSTLLKF